MLSLIKVWDRNAHFSSFVHMFSMLHAQKGEAAAIDFSLIEAWLPIKSEGDSRFFIVCCWQQPYLVGVFMRARSFFCAEMWHSVN